MKLKLLGSEAAMGTSTTNGSNFSGATNVRVFNSTGAAHLVSVETSANSLIGTLTVPGGASVIVEKDQTDEIFAAKAGVLGVGVAVR